MFYRSLVLTAVSATLLAGCASLSGGSTATAVPAAITAAVAEKSRPDADRVRDADRKPAELLAFAGIKAGDKVADLLPGGGYFTRIFSKAVGAKGTVYAMANPKAPNAAADPAAAVIAIAAEAGYGNVKVVSLDMAKPATPEPLDVVWTSLNYHDLQNRPNADLGAFNKMVFNSLKPGGVYIVIDHAAEKGSGKRDTSTLHRIDADFVKAEVQAAGFKLEAESTLLAHPADDHKSVNRETGIRGKTDQFVFKFRKPKR
jgi:predicted methyltransferase